jgi:CubicO group peptidase (beta-lactamase class C family)
VDMNIVTPESVGFSSTRLSRMNTAMHGYVDQDRLPGIVSLVARRGKVAHFECYGMMNVEANKPMQPDTLFRLYSMTKPITAVAFMLLLEQGRFLLDDPVSKYIPAFKNMRVQTGSTGAGQELADLVRPVSIRDLLTHTAGLDYWVADIFDSLCVLQVSLPEMIRRLAELPLNYQPGTVWKYSIAYDVIGHLIGVLADMPFDVYLQERVLQPLGMDDTGFYVPPNKLDRLAALYVATDTGDYKVKDAPAGTSPFANVDVPPSGGGGLVSTAGDYLRFAQMLLNGGTLDGTRLLGRKTVARMTMNHLLDDVLAPKPLYGPGGGYGLGVGVELGEAQRPTLTSTGAYGWSSAGSCLFWVDPQEALIGLSLQQVLWGSRLWVGKRFQNLVYQAIVD